MTKVKQYTKKVNGKTINVKSYERKEPILSAKEYLAKSKTNCVNHNDKKYRLLYNKYAKLKPKKEKNFGYEFNKLDNKNNFEVNDFTKIKNFKLVSDDIVTMQKFGEDYDYLKFEGKIENDNVTGLVCIKDENVYNLQRE